MAFFDPKHKELGMRGFYDPKDIRSLIRAIHQDQSDRFYDSILAREGKLTLQNSQSEHRVHNAIMMQDMYFQPFQNITELHAFVYNYAANLTEKEFREQENVLFILKSRLNMVPRGVLECIGAMNPWKPKAVLHTPKWES